jgi:hypothetical protein
MLLFAGPETTSAFRRIRPPYPGATRKQRWSLQRKGPGYKYGRAVGSTAEKYILHLGSSFFRSLVTPAEGRREYIHVGSTAASLLPTPPAELAPDLNRRSAGIQTPAMDCRVIPPSFGTHHPRRVRKKHVRERTIPDRPAQPTRKKRLVPRPSRSRDLIPTKKNAGRWGDRRREGFEIGFGVLAARSYGPRDLLGRGLSCFFRFKGAELAEVFVGDVLHALALRPVNRALPGWLEWAPELGLGGDCGAGDSQRGGQGDDVCET